MNNKNKIKLFIVRHGETEWSKLGKIQTHSNGSETYLTNKGREEAQKTGIILSKESIEIIYHSALDRTKETAKIISQLVSCTEIIQDKRINDGNLSFLDGLTVEEFKIKFPEIYEAREKDKFHYRIPNLFPEKNYPVSESMVDVLHRVVPFIEKIVDDERNTLIVGHRGVNRLILYHLLEGFDCAITKEDASKIPVLTLGIYRVDIELNSRKVFYNFGKGWVNGFWSE